MTSDQSKSGKSGKSDAKLTGIEQLEAFMNDLEHPLKPEIEVVLENISANYPQLKPHIKWNAPSFRYREEDRVTFNLRGKDYFLLVFHCGAKVKQRAEGAPLIDDPTGLLEWAAVDRATVKLTDMGDVLAKKDKLAEVIGMWLEVI
ncbi:DUF1801 domain-containing protein [Cohnella lupini]|nr:DUF1801 domain-containing protein [Cohnella lupini]